MPDQRPAVIGGYACFARAVYKKSSSSRYEWFGSATFDDFVPGDLMDQDAVDFEGVVDSAPRGGGIFRPHRLKGKVIVTRAAVDKGLIDFQGTGPLYHPNGERYVPEN